MNSSPQVNTKSLWDRILEVIQGQVNSQSFQTWFRPTRLLRFEDNILYVEGPNQFFTDWLSEHHMNTILTAAKEVTGSTPQVELVIGDEERDESKPPVRTNRRANISFFKRYTQSPKTKGLLLNVNYTFNEFVVGNSNRMAHAASLAVSEKLGRVYNPLFIYGGVGLGKTHLAQAVAHFVLEEQPKTKVFYTSSESFMNELIMAIRKGKTLEFKNKYRNVDLLIIDDIQFLAGKESTQEEFFHTFNALYDSGKQIVMTSDRPPKDIKGLEERLVSRFEWGLITDIQTPDLETRLAILKKKTEKDGMSIPDDVLFLIAENVISNIRELEGSLIRLLAFAGLTGSQINIELAREVLQEFIKNKPRTPNIPDIQKRVAESFTTTIELMKSDKRSSKIVLPRQVAIYLSREMTSKSLVEIGRHFGGRDHTTVLHACRKITKKLKEDTELFSMVSEIQQSFKLWN
ncbi:MAG: chromosomal replication initiator protein DnaA [bacterium]|nr:chromosomal replication initiator protein DnaA [bacterium]